MDEKILCKSKSPSLGWEHPDRIRNVRKVETIS